MVRKLARLLIAATTWLALAGVGGVECRPYSVCVPPPPPPASCVDFGATGEAEVFLLMMKRCVGRDDVEITQARTGRVEHVKTDAEGRPDVTPAFTLVAGDQFHFRFGSEGCRLGFCARFVGAGPAVECGAVAH